MNIISNLSELIDEPQRYIDEAGVRYAGRAGLTGYILGALSIFIFLRLFSSLPPGGYSFMIVLSSVLGANFVFASAMHLFLEMTGSKGNALKLFFLLGITELLWSALIPLGFMAKAGFLNPAAAALLCLIAVLAARISLIRRLYAISRNKALLALGLPYTAVMAGFVVFFVYTIVYLVWLVG